MAVILLIYKRITMKKLIGFAIAMIFATTIVAQTESKATFKLPAVDIQNVNGAPFNTKDIKNGGKPVIITFWATWCKPCIKEHDAINEVYSDWAKETGVKMYSISIDNARSSKQVLPLVNGKGWDFEVLLDPNGDFKRAMNVNVPPHTFIVNGSGEVVWQHVGYLDGDEAEYIKVVKKLLKGETIN